MKWIIQLLVVIIVVVVCSANVFSETLTHGTVVRVVDGDTVIVMTDSGVKRNIRLIGVDTPETVHPKKPVECYGKEASNYMKTLLTGKEVDVAFQKNLDKYGRGLGYIYLDGMDVNAHLIRYGYGKAYLRFKFSKKEEYAEIEDVAREKGRGLWVSCSIVKL